MQIEQEGLSISEEDTGTSGVGDDSTFLMEVMELNETLARSPNTNTLIAMKKENESKLFYDYIDMRKLIKSGPLLPVYCIY